MYEKRINEIKQMISEQLNLLNPHFPDKNLKQRVKRKVEYYRTAILYLETKPKFEFIQSEILRMMKQIDVRHDIQEEIKNHSQSIYRNKKETQEDLNNSDYKQQKDNLKMLQFCIQGIKIESHD